MAYSGNRKLALGPLASPLFIIASLAFLLNQGLEWQIFFIPYLHSYFDDLLCIPIVLSIALNIQKNFTFKDSFYKLSIYHVIITVIYFSIVFEWFLPQYATRYTADPLDIVAYSLGGFFFYRWLNK